MKLTQEDINKIDKTAYRKALIECGQYSVPTHKVHKNKKAYTRKQKHKLND